MTGVELGHAVGYLVVLFVALAFGVLVTQLAMLVTTVYLHRHLAHRGVELRPEVRAASRVVLWITTALKPRQWAWVHRQHHAVEDTPNDPHGPLNFGGGWRGARYVLLHNGSLYTRATHNQRLADKYRDLTADRWDRWFFDHGEFGLAIGVAVLCACMALIGHAIEGGWLSTTVGAAAGLLAAGSHAAGYILAGGAVNGFGHASSTQQPNGDTPATCPSSRGSRAGKAGIATTTPPKTHHASASATNSTSAGSQSEAFACCDSRTSPHAEPQDSNDCKPFPAHDISIGSLPQNHTSPSTVQPPRETRTISTATVNLACISAVLRSHVSV